MESLTLQNEMAKLVVSELKKAIQPDDVIVMCPKCGEAFTDQFNKEFIETDNMCSLCEHITGDILASQF